MSASPVIPPSSSTSAETNSTNPVDLNTPLQIGPYTLPHRILMASMTRSRGQPGPLQVEYYTQRSHANGGASLIISEHLCIEPQGTEWILAPVLNQQKHVAGWKTVIDAVHKAGSLMFAQLWHGGRCVHPLMQGGQPAQGPSAIAAAGGRFRLLTKYVNPASAAIDGIKVNSNPDEVIGYTVPEAIEDPMHYVRMYANSARLALAAGFDGIEVHGASGFLLHQFLDSGSNQRTDEWGGSVENRCRFPLAVMDELISIFGAQRVGIKLAPCGGYNDVGMSEEETRATFTYLLNQLRSRGIAYVQLQRYTPDMDAPRGTATFDVRELKAAFAHPTGRFILNGGFNATTAAEAVQAGDCDAVTFASYFLPQPDFAARVFGGHPIREPTYAHLYGDFFQPKDFARGYTTTTIRTSPFSHSTLTVA